MPITLGLNIASLRSARDLNRTSSDLQTVYTKLSSGQRINKASDDAAGLAIADSLGADRRVFAQGVRNLNDGISILNVADGALQELTNITLRLTELAQQAANGSLSKPQREALDEEAQALSDEYFRIAKSTEFNGRKIFEGDYGILSLQAGYGTDARIAEDLGGQIGTGEFEDRVTFSIGNLPDALVSGDFNNDGHTDFIHSNRTNDSFHIYLGTGDGGFGTAIIQTHSDDVTTLDAADVNNDGILDLVSADATNDRTGVYIGNGDGTFSNATFYGGGSYTSGSVFGDFNGDGNIDIATSDLVDDNVNILLGNGDGTFQDAGNYAVGNTPLSLTIGDFNGDGLDDVVTANNLDNEIGVILSNGDGTFGTVTSYAAGSSPGPIIVEDTNNDGILDIIAGARGSDEIGIFLGNGDGSFQARTSYSVGGFTATHTLTAGDYNGDGNIDIANADNTDSTISILIGNGDGTYQAATSFSTATGLTWLISDDFNEDGVVDLAVPTDSDNVVSIYYGSTTSGVAPLLDFSLRSLSDAKQALSRFEQKLEHLSTQRGEIGAFQSRVEVAERVLGISEENYAIAESRIRDADIAAEAAQLVRLQILQQASTAVLAQANQQPSLTLSLLQEKSAS